MSKLGKAEDKKGRKSEKEWSKQIRKIKEKQQKVNRKI